MKILLLKPFWPYPCDNFYSTYNRIWPPLCLANCAAILEKAGFSVNILDAHAERIPPKRIYKYIKGYEKIFITSSSLDKWLCGNLDTKPFLETIKIIKQETDNFFIMGFHGTLDPQRIFYLISAKAMIIGEPEMVVLDICNNKPFNDIKGIAYKQNGNFFVNERESFSLEKLPVPAFHLLNFDLYKYEILGKRFSLFETSRGCPFPCQFCNKTMYNSKFRSKNPQQIINELETGINKFRIKAGYFIDLNFTYNREMVERICEYLTKNNKTNFQWCCQTRADLLNKELIEKMARANCRIIHIGIESGSSLVLSSVHKKVNLKKTKTLIEYAHKLGIKTVCFFIFGSLNERKQDRIITMKVAKELGPTYVSYRLSHVFLANDDIEEVKQDIRKAFINYYFFNVPYLLMRIFSSNPLEIFKEMLLFLKILIRK